MLTVRPAVHADLDVLVAGNADTVAHFKAGKQATFGFLVGQVMKQSGGKANPKLINDLLKKMLAGDT